MHKIRRKIILKIISAFSMIVAIVVLISSTPVKAEMAQQSFSTPEEAVKALVEAVKTRNIRALDQLFGPNGKELRSNDEVQAAAEFDEFVKHISEKTDFVRETETKIILHIGKENWPFPIPLVKKGDNWLFDTEAGKEEILNRRIGEDELTAMLVCKTYVKAQREYALKDWDGDGIVAYAKKLRSDPGKKNGLFWRRQPGESASPFGELVAQARMEGYKKDKSLFKDDPVPFHGYYFNILLGQGKHAPGGKYNYVINGNMVAGFAFIAFPSEWGKSGVMTFIVNQQGRIYQKNLGPDTLKIVSAIKVYDPDKTWTPVNE